MRRLLLAGMVAAAALVGPVSAAHADDWQMAACAYEQSWIPQCSEPWIFAAPTITYRVRPHDTLWRIAVKAYGSEHAGHRWVDIARANHIQGTRIWPGEVLRIPRAFFDPAHPGTMTPAGPRRA